MPYTNIPKHLWGKMERCVTAVQAQGKDKRAAIAICYESVTQKKVYEFISNQELDIGILVRLLGNKEGFFYTDSDGNTRFAGGPGQGGGGSGDGGSGEAREVQKFTGTSSLGKNIDVFVSGLVDKSIVEKPGLIMIMPDGNVASYAGSIDDAYHADMASIMQLPAKEFDRSIRLVNDGRVLSTSYGSVGGINSSDKQIFRQLERAAVKLMRSGFSENYMLRFYPKPPKKSMTLQLIQWSEGKKNLDLTPQDQQELEAAQDNTCLGCTHFNEPASTVPGFCKLHDEPRKHTDICDEYSSKECVEHKADDQNIAQILSARQGKVDAETIQKYILDPWKASTYEHDLSKHLQALAARTFGHSMNEELSEIPIQDWNLLYVIGELYNYTQEQLLAKGLSENETIPVYHPYMPTEARPKQWQTGDEVRIKLNPLTSWSTEMKEAADFASMLAAPGNPVFVLKTFVPVKSIVSTPETGFGEQGTGEVVLAGGEYEALVEQRYG